MSAVFDFLKKSPLKETILVICLSLLCLITIKVILIIVDKAIKRSKLDTLACKILRTVTKVFLLFTAVIIVLSSIGIEVSSLIAAFSIIGIAFSLAIQDFLSNVFSGIQIISNHPFKVGDYVDAGGESGTIREVGLFYTKLDTPDKKLIQIPNRIIANESITNYSQAENRRLEFLFSVAYDSDVEKVKSVMLQLLTEHPLIIKEDALSPSVHVKEFKESDICYTARAWCENKNYWTVYFEIMDEIKPTFESHGIQFSYPHVNVHMMTK